MKPKVSFICQNCGFQTPKWMGRCPSCGEWNTLIEEIVEEIPSPGLTLSSGAPLLYEDIKEIAKQRIKANIHDFNQVLGGGVVQGSLILIGGEPGIGKSTLMLQVSRDLASQKKRVLYVSGEESLEQIKLRGERLGLAKEKIYFLAETILERILQAAEQLSPEVLIIDSVQTVYSSQLTSSPGTISQVREVTNRVFRLAKAREMATFLIGHITKEGSLAGPKSLEHIVDVVLSFEGERDHSYRVLRALKNRFGPVSELAIFEMSEEGLTSVANPSAFFLRERPPKEPGSVVVCTMKGTRPFLAEIQALVSSSLFMGNPRRMTVGLDRFRAAMLMAIAEKKLGYSLAGEDIYLNVAGGLEIEEPAADVGIILALVSSVKNRALPPEVAVFGEIGLSGEIRSVTQPFLRAKEAASMGFRTVVLPQGNKDRVEKDGLKGVEVVGVAKVQQLIGLFF
ncbi:MAG: DNA repair protein RadA [Candidatus Aminicenantes bacterium 4484_214]|nr:MAG: DNA repair protein RadA [Candidatus Aminicenantes bacterium 4484_214]